MRTVRVACCLALLAGVFVCRLDGASAQGSAEAQQACTPDAMRLCGDAIPDVAKVTACMKAKYAQLSEPCRVVMRGGGGSSAGRGRRVARETTHHRRAREHCDPYSHLCS
jgi:hypothetical protein